MTIETDVLIIGGGIIGLSVARELEQRFGGSLKIVVAEKEGQIGVHASGRNSGVLHAGFYYEKDSLKARFTVEGNKRLTSYCLRYKLPINQCGKVVVTKGEKDIPLLYELKRRGEINGCRVYIIDTKELRELEPNARTYELALFSPSTSTIDPTRVCRHLVDNFGDKTSVLLNTRVIGIKDTEASCSKGKKIRFKYLFNCAGLYADKIAQMVGVGRNYILLPFKGLYLTYTDNNLIRRHIYPVPNIHNPFLGVHFTKGVYERVKVGPTAMPALWRENYSFFKGISPKEFSEIFPWELVLFFYNNFNFREITWQEIKKYWRRLFIKEASKLVKKLESSCFGPYLPPGIRAQLLDKKKKTLVMDFVVEKGERSLHILNAVSPAFTSAFAFAEYIVRMAEKEMPFYIK